MHAKLSRTLFVLAAVAPAAAAQSNVSASLKGTTLTIKGSAGVDDLTLANAELLADGDGPTPVDILVTPNNGTTLDGASAPVTFPGVLKLKISLGDGADVLGFSNFNFVTNPVLVNAGPGDDHVTLQSTITGPFKFIAGPGNDTFELHSSHLDVTKVSGSSGVLTMPVTSTYFHDLTLVSGPEIDVLNWTDVTVDFRLKLNVGGGNDLVSFTAGTVGTESTLKLGPGNNHFTDDGGTYGEFVALVGGSGDDEVVFEDSTIGNDLNAKLGGGLNKLTLKAQDDSMVVGNSATIKGGGAIDTIKLMVAAGTGSVIIGNDLVVALKSGANELQATGDVSTGNDLRYTGGALDDVVDLDAISIGNDANLVLAAGFNDVILNDALVGNDLRITAGNGDDTVQLTGTTSVGGNQLIHLGGGNNTGP